MTIDEAVAISEEGISEEAPTPTDRRAARRATLLDAASELVASTGVDGLTMQAIADRVDCAVGTIYTYFPSKSALLAALMSNAVRDLMTTFESTTTTWESTLHPAETPVGSLERVLGFTWLFVESRTTHPNEFEFLQMLVTTPENLIDPADVVAVLPDSLEFLGAVQDLLARAVAAGALAPATGEDDDLRRTLRWTGAIHGALLVSNVASVSGLPEADAYDAHVLTQQVTADLLTAWGAQPDQLRAARFRFDHAAA
ncbi:MAG: TetR/AcrR family transcriptional regulator [Actinomycetota bacterium]